MSSTQEFAGKVVIITGGARNIGFEFEIDQKSLTKFALMAMPAVIGVEFEGFDENLRFHKVCQSLSPECREHFHRIDMRGDIMHTNNVSASLRPQKMKGQRASHTVFWVCAARDAAYNALAGRT